jgi:hypothetical protein
MNTYHKYMCELTPGETENTQGGIWMNILTGLGIAAGASIINNWDSFKAGLMGEPDPASTNPLQP